MLALLWLLSREREREREFPYKFAILVNSTSLFNNGSRQWIRIASTPAFLFLLINGVLATVHHFRVNFVSLYLYYWIYLLKAINKEAISNGIWELIQNLETPFHSTTFGSHVSGYCNKPWWIADNRYLRAQLLTRLLLIRIVVDKHMLLMFGCKLPPAHLSLCRWVSYWLSLMDFLLKSFLFWSSFVFR